jgi:serine/threonine-protein kinase RsbW
MSHNNGWKILVDTHFASDVLEGRRVMEELLAQLEPFAWVQDELFGVHLAVEEAVVNAIRHGNREDAAKRVRLVCKICDERLRIEVADEGPGFNPADVPDPTENENLEVPSGRGIMLMRNFMHHVEYNEAGNRVVLEKHRIPSDN